MALAVLLKPEADLQYTEIVLSGVLVTGLPAGEGQQKLRKTTRKKISDPPLPEKHLQSVMVKLNVKHIFINPKYGQVSYIYDQMAGEYCRSISNRNGVLP